MSEAPAYTKDHPFPAKLIENRLLNKPGSTKETRHFAVDLRGSGLVYRPGDSLGIFPSNRSADVEEILERLGATGAEMVSPPSLRLGEPILLREALLHHLSLAKPGRHLIEELAAKAADPSEKTTLEGMLAPAQKNVLQSFLEAREFVDLLAEFPSARLTVIEFLNHLRKQLPRLYSIASSPLLHPDDPHLTVAVVRYSTNGRSRVGVCSSFLADRVPLGQAMVRSFVAHSHFRLPEEAGKDCIMVGPGTGIAPFRAFVQERVATKASGRNWVFFGDQRRGTDFLYEEEWQDYLQRGHLARLDTAFSRDQAHKIYVQDRMRENAAMLWTWLKGGAHFYVCGDAQRMAKDVDVALHEVVAEQGGMTRQQAADYVKEMKRERRYQRDVY
jgi:sulfite reductase (NADPH) flavoprotein alpha-component